MKKLLLTGIFAMVLSILPAANLFAQSYNGTTVEPEADGTTYVVTAQAGDAVTLSNVGNGSVAITFANDVDGSIVVEESQARPADASMDAPGTVNIYYDVTLVGITNADITSSVWSFSVSKDFLSQNDVTASNVFLHHYSNGNWERLTTRQVSETDTTVTFEAEVDSFSPFAVTAVDGLSNTGSPYLTTAIVAISTIAVVGATFMLSRKQRA